MRLFLFEVQYFYYNCIDLERNQVTKTKKVYISIVFYKQIVQLTLFLINRKPKNHYQQQRLATSN